MSDIIISNIVSTTKGLTSEGIQKTPALSQNSRKAPPTLWDLLEHRKQECKKEMNCMAIGTIQTFYPDTQTADLSINYWQILKQSQAIANQIADSYAQYPPLVGVPVLILGGGEGHLTFPITNGDTCIVIFNDKDMDNWLKTGQVGIPNSDRVHNINDAVAIVGIKSFAESLANYSTDSVNLYYGTTKIKLSDTATTVSAGVNNFDPIFNVEGAIGLKEMLLPPLSPTPGCFYFNSALNNWYGWKIVAYDPITGLPIYGWVAFT